MSSIINREALLGSANTFRGKINTVTLGIAMVLSIMVINNYRQCQDGKGYPASKPIVQGSYIISIMILVVACLLFAFDLAVMARLIK